MIELKAHIDSIRKDFPTLQQEVNGKPLVYFDNGATTHKPRRVIDTINTYYVQQNSNIHRGVHTLSQNATSLYEESRNTVQQFLNASSINEIIYTSGTTGSINLLASILKKGHFKKGDEIIISEMEHHSNIVPWQMVCEEIGTVLKVIPVNEKGELVFETFKELLSEKTALISIVHVSNALGTINPIKDYIAEAKKHNSLIHIDGAQGVSHGVVDVQALDVDFYSFSAHKLFGPTGVGILYGKEHLLEKLPPYQGGGDMIKTVTLEKTTYNDLPHKFEAGTPNIAGGIALKAAIDYVQSIGFDFIQEQERILLDYLTSELRKVDGLRIIGDNDHKTSVVSFIIDGVHPYDIGVIVDKMGIAVRTGHHCTQPLMDKFNVPGTVRASLSFYNTIEEIDIFIKALERSLNMLR